MAEAGGSRGRSPLHGPLVQPRFRQLWLAWLAGNVAMWMHEVTASWRMAQMTDDPMMVALVQAAGSVPLFLLGLPSGALADRLDRRWLYGWAQGFIAVAAAVLAGMMIAGLGTAAVFAANAAMSALACAMVLRAPASSNLPRRPHPASPVQPLWNAMGEGLRYTMRTPALRAILLRAWVFFMQSIGLIALLPLVARQISTEAAVYTTLLAAMGTGAVAAALLLPGLSGLAAQPVLCCRQRCRRAAWRSTR